MKPYWDKAVRLSTLQFSLGISLVQYTAQIQKSSDFNLWRNVAKTLWQSGGKKQEYR
jgi:hypothetical protein